MTHNIIDSLPFAFQAKKGVEDARATLLGLAVSHLEGKKTHMPLMPCRFLVSFQLQAAHIVARKLPETYGFDFGTTC